MRVRLFVWFSVSEFLLVVPYEDYKLEKDSLILWFLHSWFTHGSLRDCYSSSWTRSSSSGSRNGSDEASSVERHLVGLLPPASGS